MSALTNHTRTFKFLLAFALLLGLTGQAQAQFYYKPIRESTNITTDALSIVQLTTNSKAVQFRQIIVYCYATGTSTAANCTVTIERGGTTATATEQTATADWSTTETNATTPGFKVFHTSNAGSGKRIGICKSSICPFDANAMKLDKETSRQYTIRVSASAAVDVTYDVAVEEVTK